MTKAKLKLISDPDTKILFEKGTTGRVSYVCNSYREANNKYLKFYDSKQESKRIICIDARIELNKYSSNSSKRCVLKVHL